MNFDHLYEETNVARKKLFESLGRLDSDVIAHGINPSFMGGPSWPATRQAFSIIRKDGSIIIASTGLSDPFEDATDRNSGFELEMIAETKSDIGDDITSSWLFKLVYYMSQQAACNGKLKYYLEQYNVTTMELTASDAGLEDFQDEKGMVGVMLGVEHPELPKHIVFPGGNIILVTIKILTPEELKYVVEFRAEGRNKLHRLFQESETYHFCEPKRLPCNGNCN